jgi:predicted dehydrogenase
MPASSSYGIALLGCGGMATAYRDAYTNIPNTTYELVVDVNQVVAEEAAQTLGVARFSTDWRDALTENIHIVDISTPNHLHEEQAVALLNAGKHVILQKPMAPTLLGCHNIVQAARASGCQAAVYISDLEDPLAWDIKAIVQGGYLGQITGMRARYAHRGGLNAPVRDASYWRGSLEKTGGGSFIQLSIHHINLIQWLLEDNIQSVMGYSKNLCSPNIGGDDLTVASVAFEKSGIYGVFESAWNADGSGFSIYGTEGAVHFTGTEGGSLEATLNRPFTGILAQTDDSERNRVSVPWRSTALSYLRGPENTYNQHRAFIEAVQTGTRYFVTAEQGLRDVAVCKAVYHSAETGVRVVIDDFIKENTESTP